jgi:hypothetical protein
MDFWFYIIFFYFLKTLIESERAFSSAGIFITKYNKLMDFFEKFNFWKKLEQYCFWNIFETKMYKTIIIWCEIVDSLFSINKNRRINHKKVILGWYEFLPTLSKIIENYR